MSKSALGEVVRVYWQYHVFSSFVGALFDEKRLYLPSHPRGRRMVATNPDVTVCNE